MAKPCAIRCTKWICELTIPIFRRYSSANYPNLSIVFHQPTSTAFRLQCNKIAKSPTATTRIKNQAKLNRVLSSFELKDLWRGREPYVS